MALIVNEKFLTVAYGKTLLIYDIASRNCLEITVIKKEDAPTDKKSTENSNNVEGSQISTIACSKSLKYISVANNDKQLYIYSTEDWSLINTRTVPKRCTSMVFGKNDSLVLAADKSGDVNSFPVNDPTISTLVVGHVSMLVDLVLCKNDKFLVTSDRDEKIRVSNFPNSYSIATFCLGHLDFVSQLVYTEDQEILISGSGDGTVKIWNYQIGQELDSFDCLQYVDQTKNVKCPNLVPNQSDSDNVCRGVDVRNISYLSTLGLLAVSFERRSEVIILELEDRKLSFKMSVNTKGHGRVLDLKMSGSSLFVLHLTSEEKNVNLSCYEIVAEDSLVQLRLKSDVASEEDSLSVGLAALNLKMLAFEAEVSKVTDWSKFNCSLHKMHIDNMSEYVDRKRQRMDEMNARKEKKQKLESHE